MRSFPTRCGRKRRGSGIIWRGGQDLPNGMYCRMYYPKMEGELTPLDVCPPALVFRGSEVNEADVDELAVHVDLMATVTASGPPGMILDTSTFAPPIPVISPTGRFPPSATRADIRATGMVEQPLVQPSGGREVIRASLGDMIGLGNINIDWAQLSLAVLRGKRRLADQHFSSARPCAPAIRSRKRLGASGRGRSDVGLEWPADDPRALARWRAGVLRCDGGQGGAPGSRGSLRHIQRC